VRNKPNRIFQGKKVIRTLVLLLPTRKILLGTSVEELESTSGHENQKQHLRSARDIETRQENDSREVQLEEYRVRRDAIHSRS